MKKLAIKIAAPIIRIFWKIFQPQTIGVRVILTKGEQFLLVKHSYSDSWYLCGGGMKKQETFQKAIQRELKEELGIVSEVFKLHGVYNNFYEGKKDSIVVFSSEIKEIPQINDAEIESFDFFKFENLPSKISPGTKKRIEEFVLGNGPFYGDW